MSRIGRRRDGASIEYRWKQRVIGRKFNDSSVEIVLPIFAGPDAQKCFTLSNRAGSLIVVKCMRGECDGVLFIVMASDGC